MKNLLKSTFLQLAGLSALAMFYACTPEVEPMVVQEGPAVQAEVVTSEAELLELLHEAGLDASTMSADEKMDFLSDYLAQNFFARRGGVQTELDDITCIAQVFDGTNYYTDGAAGKSNEVVNAAVVGPIPTTSTFSGANANIYRNGVNERGNITSANPSTLSCTAVEGRSIATFRPGSQTTLVEIGCEDTDPGAYDCNGSNSVCAVYESASQNFSDLVERNKFKVEWDDTAISSATVTIRLKKGTTTYKTVTEVLNDGFFNENGLNFPTVSSNTSGFFVEVTGGGTTLTSQTFTVEND